jgi:hypothetical protein
MINIGIMLRLHKHKEPGDRRLVAEAVLYAWGLGVLFSRPYVHISCILISVQRPRAQEKIGFGNNTPGRVHENRISIMAGLALFYITVRQTQLYINNVRTQYWIDNAIANSPFN